MLTSYLVANAIVLPLSGWLSSVIGRKRFYMSCVVLFTVSSALCGMATSLEQLVFFRVLQGIGRRRLAAVGAGHPHGHLPAARSAAWRWPCYTMAILVAPVLGPTLGGYITENYSWRWIFYINLPVGCLSLFLTSIVLHDPPYLKASGRRRCGQEVPHRLHRARPAGARPGRAGTGARQGAGRRLVRLADSSSASRPIAVVALVSAVVWELRHPQPIINLRLFSDRNFSAARSCVFFAFGVLYGSNVLLPQMLQTLMGYSAT